MMMMRRMRRRRRTTMTTMMIIMITIIDGHLFFGYHEALWLSAHSHGLWPHLKPLPQERFHSLAPIYYRDADGEPSLKRCDEVKLGLIIIGNTLMLVSLVRWIVNWFILGSRRRFIVKLSWCKKALHTSPAGALLVYDTTDAESFRWVERALSWWGQLWYQTSDSYQPVGE